MSELARDLFGAPAEQACIVAVDKIGGPTAVSRAFAQRGVKLTPQAVDQWRVVPALHARLLAELAGGEPTVHQLRPDIFGPEPGQSQAAA